MSYCVNCGVELDDSAKSCPLCNTPVLNPNSMNQFQQVTPFPKESGTVETVKRKDLGILLTTFVLATAVTCGFLNALVFPKSMWSLAVIGACVILWVTMIPVVIYTKSPIYISVLYDGAATIVYLYLLAKMIDKFEWFYGLGIPLVLVVTAVIEAFLFCLNHLPKSFLTISLYLFTGIGILCAGIELVIDKYLHDTRNVSWSAVVVTICVITDIVLITMLSRRRLRDAIRRRLHF